MVLKVSISVIFMVLIFGTMQMEVIARKDIEDGEESSPSPLPSSDNSLDPEFTVEELCAKVSNKSTCVKNFGPLAEKMKNKAPLSYYMDEGAKMARAELTKAYEVSDSLKPKAQQSPNPGLTNDSLEGCKHYIDLALDRLGGEGLGEGEGEGEGPSASPTGSKGGAPSASPTGSKDGARVLMEGEAPSPAPGSGKGGEEFVANLFFSDALTFTTTCLDELELAEVPDVLKAMQEALDKSREVIRDLLGISNVLDEEANFAPPGQA